MTKRQCQLDSIVLSVIDQTLPRILQGKTLLEFNSDFITANRVSLPHILAGTSHAAPSVIVVLIVNVTLIPMSTLPRV